MHVFEFDIPKREALGCLLSTKTCMAASNRDWMAPTSMFLIHTRCTHAPGGPVHKHCPSDHIFSWQETPNVSIKTMITIIPQHKYIPRGNDHRAKLVSCIFCCEWFLLLHAIHKKLSASDFHFIALVSDKTNFSQTASIQK